MELVLVTRASKAQALVESLRSPAIVILLNLEAMMGPARLQLKEDLSSQSIVRQRREALIVLTVRQMRQHVAAEVLDHQLIHVQVSLVAGFRTMGHKGVSAEKNLLSFGN